MRTGILMIFMIVLPNVILHFQILLPLLHEFQPDLILVSAGYDAAFGDPEGEMRLTPALYWQVQNQVFELPVKCLRKFILHVRVRNLTYLFKNSQ